MAGVLKRLLENGTYIGSYLLCGGNETIEGMDGEKPLFVNEIVLIALTQ